MKLAKEKFILLFAPQPEKGGRRMCPLNLLAISTYLEKEGYDIKIYHSYDKEEYLDALNYLDQAICVGITSMTGYQILDGLKFAALVKEKNQHIPIVWGGIHPTIKPIQTIKNPYVDIVVRGQGEETFYELVKALEKGLDLKNILGIVYKENGEIIENPLRPSKDISEFPHLPYHVLNEKIESYIKINSYGKRYLPIITSEGCPFQCAFCYLSMNKFRKKWNALSPERVVEEIEHLVKKYNLSSIDIRDTNFFINMERAKQIFNGVIKKKLNIIFTGINGRVDQLANFDDEFWQLMEEAGVRELLVGVESGDQEMLNLINKGILADAILECEKKASKYKINIFNSLLTGFPPNTKDPKQIKKVLNRELNNSIELIRKIYEINPVANIILFFYTPYPGTPLYEACIKQGFKDPQTLEEWGKVDLDNKTVPWIDEKHKRKILFLRNLVLLKKITSPEYLKQKKDLKFFIIKFFCIGSLLNWWVTFRLKRKFYFFPFEKIFFVRKNS